VAVKCPGMLYMGAFGSGASYFLTTDESTSPQLPCFSLGPMAEVKGAADVGAVVGAQSLEVESSFGSTSSSGATTMDYEVNVAEGADRDLVLLAFNHMTNMDSSTLIGGRIFHGVNAVGVVTGKNLTLAATDTVTDYNFAPFSVPSGWSGDYQVSLYTSGGTVLDYEMLGFGGNSGGTYHTLPGSSADDLYIAQASAANGANNVVALRLILGNAVGDVSLAPTMSPLPSGYDLTAAAFPTFSLNHPDGDLSGYYLISYWPATIWSYTLSKGWVAGQTQFRVPDLTGLVGFEEVYPRSGEDYMWYAVAFKTSASMQSYLEARHIWIGDGGISLPRLPDMTLDATMAGGQFTTP